MLLVRLAKNNSNIKYLFLFYFTIFLYNKKICKIVVKFYFKSFENFENVSTFVQEVMML
jgi:hypothetical protein